MSVSVVVLAISTRGRWKGVEWQSRQHCRRVGLYSLVIFILCREVSVCVCVPAAFRTAGLAFVSSHRWCWETREPPPLWSWALHPSLSTPHPTRLYVPSSYSRPWHPAHMRTHAYRLSHHSSVLSEMEVLFLSWWMMNLMPHSRLLTRLPSLTRQLISNPIKGTCCCISSFLLDWQRIYTSELDRVKTPWAQTKTYFYFPALCAHSQHRSSKII